MATMITSECINCGACEPECPNTAIYQGGVAWVAPDGATHPALSDSFFYIVPEKCTECVGFHDKEACAAVCPVDCCVPNPEIVETHDVLLVRARALHPEATIPDDAPSRFKVEGAAPAPPAGPTAAPAPAPAPVAAPSAPAPVAASSAPAPVAAAPVPAVAPPAARPAAASEPEVEIPALEDWEIPIHCFRCDGGYTVPFATYRAGVVFRCPHCNGSLVPTLSMVKAVRDAVEAFHEQWRAAFDAFRVRRQRELAQFEDRQRSALDEFQARVRELAVRERAPGAPRPRRSAFAF